MNTYNHHDLGTKPAASIQDTPFLRDVHMGIFKNRIRGIRATNWAARTNPRRLGPVHIDWIHPGTTKPDLWPNPHAHRLACPLPGPEGRPKVWVSPKCYSHGTLAESFNTSADIVEKIESGGLKGLKLQIMMIFCM
ncbi:hypothetical protein OSB04_026654, partial [Centaurea solstitialis]